MLYNHIAMGFFSFLYDVILITGTTIIGVSGAFFITSQFVYKNNQIAEEDSDDEDVSYELIYKEEFEALEIKELPDKEIIESLSSEVDTPNGEIVMTYTVDNETFVYFSDRRNIPLRFLNVVAQKFVIDHDCLALYKIEETTEESINASVKEPFEESEQSYYEWICSKFSWSSEAAVTPPSTVSASEAVTASEAATTSEEAPPSEAVTASEEAPPSEEVTASEEAPNDVFASYKKNPEVSKGVSKDISKVMNKYRFGGSILDFNNRKSSEMNEALEISFSKYKEMVKNKTE